MITNNSKNARKLARKIIARNLILNVDLDGVLFCAKHRQLVKQDGSLCLENYRLNSTAEKVALDKSLALLETIKILNSEGVKYNVITARVICPHTQKLLNDRQVFPTRIMARMGEGDNRKDHDLKSMHLSKFTRATRKRMILVDDNTNNIKAARALGLHTLQVDYDGH